MNGTLATPQRLTMLAVFALGCALGKFPNGQDWTNRTVVASYARLGTNFTVAGCNVTFMLTDKNPCNHSVQDHIDNRARIQFAVATAFDDRVQGMEDTRTIAEMGLKDPKDGISACINDYYCIPGPCRVLDMNYFADPTYDMEMIENPRWKAPSPRAFVKSDDDGGNKWYAVGRTQCNPTFGTQLEYYDGAVIQFVNATPNPDFEVKATPGSYSYMSRPNTPSSEKLWPDILPMPPVLNSPQGNENPLYMYGNNKTMRNNWNETIEYTCESSNNDNKPGMKVGLPVVWLEPVDECNNSNDPDDCILYRPTTTFNKTAFTAAGAYWNSAEACTRIQTRYSGFKCDGPCSNPTDGAKGCLPTSGVPSPAAYYSY